MSNPENSNEEVVVSHLWSSYSKNPELIELEKVGLLRGLKRGKITNVPLEVLFESLEKQYKDWVRAFNIKPEEARHKIPAMKRTLADLRNVAGIIFLKLKEGDKRE